MAHGKFMRRTERPRRRKRTAALDMPAEPAPPMEQPRPAHHDVPVGKIGAIPRAAGELAWISGISRGPAAGGRSMRCPPER